MERRITKNGERVFSVILYKTTTLSNICGAFVLKWENYYGNNEFIPKTWFTTYER